MSSQGPEYKLVDPPVIKLPHGAINIQPGIGTLDSPVLSADGTRLAVQVEIYRNRVLPYEVHSIAVAQLDEHRHWGQHSIVREGRYCKLWGRMKMPVQPAFTPGGDELILTQIEFDSLLGIPSILSLRSCIERLPWLGGPAEPVLDARGSGLKVNELVQHARISPRGRWLTFYTRVHEKQQGVYLLDLQTRRQYRLSDTHDKHPTWAPDGKRIYFHHQFGGKRHRFDFFSAGQERSVLGFFELAFDEQGGSVTWQRHLLDDPEETYIYHKHAAEVAGTGLLFFHGATQPDGRKKLMVRKAMPDSKVFVLRPTWAGTKLKELKHPCSSRQKGDLVFIAKPKGGDRYNLLMALTPQALKKIEQVLKEAG